MGLSIIDLIPSLGRYVARNRAGAQQSALDQSSGQALDLLGQAPSLDPNAGAQPGQFGQVPGSGLMQDPTSFQNQMKFSMGLMGLSGYQDAGSRYAGQAMSNQLGLPMEVMRLRETMRKNNMGTSAMRNVQAMIDTKETDPAYSAAMQEYLFKPTSVVNVSTGDRTAGSYAAEAVQAGAVGNEILGGGYLPSYADQLAYDLLPFGTGNYAVSEEYQTYRTAANTWGMANLRPESGALIGVEEAKQNYLTYWPQPGDGEAVIKQKAQARAQKEQSRINNAGKGEVTVVPDIIPGGDAGSGSGDGAGDLVKELPPGFKPVESSQRQPNPYGRSSLGLNIPGQ